MAPWWIELIVLLTGLTGLCLLLWPAAGEREGSGASRDQYPSPQSQAIAVEPAPVEPPAS